MRPPPPPPRDDGPADEPELISTTDARAGTTGNWVRYVLIISVALAAIGMLVTYMGSPKGVPDGAVSRPGPG